MNFAIHRINTSKELKKIPLNYGVEIDIRDKGDRLVLQHDPFKGGEDFEEYLKNYKHNILILNIKSERIEFKVIELLKKYNVTNYFFLDCSFPMIYNLYNSKEKNVAVRFSEIEGIDTILKLKNKINWVWIDCFTKLPIDKNIFKKLKKAGFNICLVSPDLHGRVGDIEFYKKKLRSLKICPDLICTKLNSINKWL